MTAVYTLEDKWRLAADELSIDVVIPASVDLPSGRHVEARVLVKDFGGPRGILIDDDILKLRGSFKELVEAGYGFSQLLNPSRHGEDWDPALLIEMLADWGWFGPPDERPEWLPEPQD